MATPMASHECQWGECRLRFDNSELLDQHVGRDHIKTQKVALAASTERKEADKGVVCQWLACESDKVYRDSWNLVTHVRYKHTHYKPYACTHEGCGKRFVQLHQMKKHTQTTHSRSSRVARADKKRPAQPVAAEGEGAEADADFDEGGELAQARARKGARKAADVSEPVPPLATRRARRARGGAPTLLAVDEVGDEGNADDADYVGEQFSTQSARPPRRLAGMATSREAEAAQVLEQVRFSPVPPELLQASVMQVDDSPARSATPLSSAFDRANGVVSPTSLLASNTRWQSSDQQSVGGMSRSLWSPLPMGPGPRTPVSRAGAPTPPVPDDVSNTLGGSFTPIMFDAPVAPDALLRPIPSTNARFLSSPNPNTGVSNGPSEGDLEDVGEL